MAFLPSIENILTPSFYYKFDSYFSGRKKHWQLSTDGSAAAVYTQLPGRLFTDDAMKFDVQCSISLP